MSRADGITPFTSCDTVDIDHTHALNTWIPQDSHPETKTYTIVKQCQSNNCASRMSNHEYPILNPHVKHHFAMMPHVSNNNRESTEAYNSQLSNKRNSEQAYLTDWYKKCKSSFSSFSRMSPKVACASSIPCTSTATETQSNIITINDIYRNQEIQNGTSQEYESHREKLPLFHHGFAKDGSIPHCLTMDNGCVTECKKRKISSDMYPILKPAVFEKWSNPNLINEIQVTIKNDRDICLDTPRIKTEQNFDTNNSICGLKSHFDRNQAQTLCEKYQYSLDNKKLESCTKSYCNNHENLKQEIADDPSNYANSKCCYNQVSIYSPEQYARNSIFSFVYQYPLSVWEYYLLIERELCVRVAQINLPLLVTHVYNPLDYAFEMHCDFVQKFCNSQRPVLFLGMNPGPFGMSQTGVSEYWCCF